MRIEYSSQVRTEGNRTADFVFPGATQYRDSSFPTHLLTVLAAKSTCKDRWPQVLADADRIPRKHLGTLDAALSNSQLNDIISKQIVPVIPRRIREGYSSTAAYGQILDITSFITHVREQAARPS